MYSLQGSPDVALVSQAIELAARAKLQHLRDLYFDCLLACTGLVGIGLLMEVLEIRHDVLEAIGRKSRQRKYWLTLPIDRKEYPAEASPRAKVLSAVGWVLIVLGVIGEGVFEGFVSKYDSSLSHVTDAIVAEAQKESAQAEATAKGFDAQIAGSDAKAKSAEAIAKGFEAQITDANARAAQAELELAKLKTPRTLSKEQLSRIRSRVLPFAGTPFDLWVSVDSDSTALMELIDATLRSAGWKFNDPTSGIIKILFANKAGIIATTGVSLHVPEEHEREWGPAIAALRDALIAEGIPTIAGRDTIEGEKEAKRDRIHVMIGSKPLN